MASTTLYRVILRNPANDDLFELQPKSWSMDEELNKEQKAKFTLGYEDVKIIADAYGTTVIAMFTATVREIYIERRDANDAYQKIFWGQITSFNLAPKGQGDQEFSIDAVSWFGLLSKRIAGIPIRTFTATDAGEIAWTLIDEAQGSDSPYSDLGITEGTIDASVDRDRTYKFDNVHDSIYNLSNSNLANGFDFEVDNTKAFNVYYPLKGTNKFNITFDERTLANWNYKKSLVLSMVNKVHVIGQSINDEVLYSTRNADNSFKTDWGLLESKLDASEIIETTTLDDKGDAELTAKQAPPVEFTAEHYDDGIGWFDYGLGDNVKVNLPQVELNNTTKRVIKKSLSLDVGKSIGYIKVDLDLVQL